MAPGYSSLPLSQLQQQLEHGIHRGPSVVLDNARFLMMTLVIATQLISPQFTGYLDVLDLMHPFQTRTLAFISGFVNKTSGRTSSCWNVYMKSRNTMVQILIFGMFLEPICYQFMVYGRKRFTFQGYPEEMFKQLFFPGQNVQWYLYGLLWWRFSNFPSSQLPGTVRVALALMLSQVAKSSPISFLSLSESFECLPLFVAGDLCRSYWNPIEEYIKEELDEATPVNLLLGSRFFQILWGLALFLYFHITRLIFATAAHPVIYRQDIGWSSQVFAQIYGLAGDLMMLGQVVVFLLLICPRNDMQMTSLGRRTLTAYMLHHLMMPSTRQSMAWALSVDATHWMAYPILLLCSLLMVLQLTVPSVRKVFDPIWHPY